MKLGDRITLASLLPTEGKFTDLIITEDVRKKVAVTQEEITEFEIVAEPGSVKWNEKGIESDKEIEFTEAEKELIKSTLKKLDESGKLHVSLIGLYKEFVK